jgi:hypothetical protein
LISILSPLLVAMLKAACAGEQNTITSKARKCMILDIDLDI